MKNKIIYLDNAATTWPKPLVVREAAARAMTEYGANPGRGGHRMSMTASEVVFRARETVAEFFGMDDPSGVIFTQNCTMSLNIAIKGTLTPGSHVVISDLEHNAVIRPLHRLIDRGISYTAAKVHPSDPISTASAFEAAIRPNTRAIICMHASNVFGTRLPIREIGELAHACGITFIVDAAQTAGILPIDIKKDNIDFLCMPGHKGLYGPMGSGVLLCAGEHPLDTLIEGGTGSRSLDPSQPEDFPDRLESGTLNLPGICGIRAGIDFIRGKDVMAHEMRLITRAWDALSAISGVTLYTDYPASEHSVPLLAFNLDGVSSEETAAVLDADGIAVRAGLHCAPGAHRHFGTLDTGAVRIAPSIFSTSRDIDRLIAAVKRSLL